MNEEVDTPRDPFPTECPGCANGTNVHIGHGLIIEAADPDLRLAE